MIMGVDTSNNLLSGVVPPSALRIRLICFLLSTDGFREPAKGVCAVGRNSLLLRAEMDGRAGCPSYSAGEPGRTRLIYFH